jgi:hypothetical protein
MDGGNVTLSATFNGTPASYTWYRVLSDGVLDTVPSPSAPDLLLTPVSRSSAGDYFVVATDRAGGSAASNTAKVSVIPAGE